MSYKGYKWTIITQMTTKITTTTALILATFALVGLTTTGALAPAAFAQDPLTETTDTGVGGILDDLLDDGQDDASGIDSTETETDTTEQSGDQSETNVQSNSIDQDQTAAINEEMASGSGSDVSSNGESSAESTYKTKSKDGSSPIPGSSEATSEGNSNVSNDGTIGQNQELNNPTQVNSNEFGSDESRAAVVGFDLEFDQAIEEQPPVVDDDPLGTDGLSLPFL